MAKSVSTQKHQESTQAVTKSPISRSGNSTAGQPLSGDVQSQLATMCSSLLRNEQTLLQMLQNQIQQQTVSREGLYSFYNFYHSMLAIILYQISKYAPLKMGSCFLKLVGKF